jgi:hypothetical protein
MLLLAWTLWTPIESAAQAPVCDVPLATLTVPRSSYAEVSADPFEQRLYVYVPEIYGKPFVLATGSLDEAGFERLRMSPNVRATPVPVVRGDGSESGQFRAARNMYKVQVMSVNASGSGAVQVRICR